MKPTLSVLKHYRWRIALSLFLSLISAVSALMLPTVMSDIINEGIHNEDLGYVVRSCLLMLGISAAGLGATLGANRVSFRVTSGFCKELREMVFAKVNRMTFGEIAEIGTAGLLSRTTHDVETLAWLTSELTGSALSVPLYFFGGLVLCFLKDRMLSLIFLAVLPVVFIVAALIARKVEPLWAISDKGIDLQNQLVRERLHGLRVIRAFVREPYEHGRIEKATHDMAEVIIRSNVLDEVIGPVAMLLLNVAAVVMAYVGGARMEAGTTALKGADIFAIIQYVGLVAGGVVGGAWAIAMLPRMKVALGRIGEVLSARGMEGEEGLLTVDEPFAGAFSLSHVTFTYEGAEEPALSDISFDVAAGERVALIGSTGCGKSTVVQLLLGFYRPTEGKILFDGRDSALLSPATLRKNISPVLQKAAIFSGTVAENVRMGREDATDEEVREAIEAAQLADYVDSMPDGMNTVLEQAGKNLSGGQKQRICIARALLKRAAIYIFDDSFSALDFLTEARLSHALEARDRDRTKLVITQRVSTARRCDRTVVLERGRVVGIGRHEELLESCPVYREIFLSQNKEVAE